MATYNTVGREREQEQYEALLAQSSSWVLIFSGMIGSGKTTLLRQLAEQKVNQGLVITLDFSQLFSENPNRIDTIYLNKFIERLLPETCYDAQKRKDFDEIYGKPNNEMYTERVKDTFINLMRTFSLDGAYRRLIVLLDHCEVATEENGQKQAAQYIGHIMNELQEIMGQHQKLLYVVMMSSIDVESRDFPLIDGIIDISKIYSYTISDLSEAEVEKFLRLNGNKITIPDMDGISDKYHYFYEEITHGYAGILRILYEYWSKLSSNEKDLSSATKRRSFKEDLYGYASKQQLILNDISKKNPYYELSKDSTVLRNFDKSFLSIVLEKYFNGGSSKSEEIFNRFVQWKHVRRVASYDVYGIVSLVREVYGGYMRVHYKNEWKDYHEKAYNEMKRYKDTSISIEDRPYECSTNFFYHSIARELVNGIKNINIWLQTLEKLGKDTTSSEDIQSLLKAAKDETFIFTPIPDAAAEYSRKRYGS